MLHQVPTQINKLSRNVVMNHPNTFNAQIIRKRVTRVSADTLMGLPTIGGLGVISSEDEESVEFEPVGNAYALRADGNFAPSLMMEHMDANNGAGADYSFLIEPEILPPAAGGFEVKKNDIMYLLIPYSVNGAVIKLAYEIVAIETTSNIPPFTCRYLCNRRDDLHLI